MLAATPPMCALLGSKGGREGILCCVAAKAGYFCMQSNKLPGAVCQYEKIAACKLPQVLGRILNGHGMIGGHERLQDWEIREQLRRMGKGLLAELLNVSEGIDGVPQVLMNLQTNLLLSGLTSDKQSARGKSNADQNH